MIRDAWCSLLWTWTRSVLVIWKHLLVKKTPHCGCVQGVCKPELLLEEPSGVVQIEYRHQMLLVSTQHRSLLYCTQTQEVLQLGTKPRKR